MCSNNLGTCGENSTSNFVLLLYNKQIMTLTSQNYAKTVNSPCSSLIGWERFWSAAARGKERSLFLDVRGYISCAFDWFLIFLILHGKPRALIHHQAKYFSLVYPLQNKSAHSLMERHQAALTPRWGPHKCLDYFQFSVATQARSG